MKHDVTLLRGSNHNMEILLQVKLFGNLALIETSELHASPRRRFYRLNRGRSQAAGICASAHRGDKRSLLLASAFF